MTSDPSERTALCRYLVIAEAVGVELEPAQQRQLLKERASLVHELPDGSRREYSPATLRRWLRLYQERGLDGLRPQRRRDQGSVRAHAELIEEACRLRRELPARSANQISRNPGAAPRGPGPGPQHPPPPARPGLAARQAQ